VVAFDYWRMRVQAERTNEARQARKDVYDADKLSAQGARFEEARRLYEQAWDSWAIIFKQYPDLMNNSEAQDLIESISRYRDLLGQLDQPFPAEFKLNDLLDMHYDGQQLREQIRLIQGTAPATAEQPKLEPSKPDETKQDPSSPNQPPADVKKPKDEDNTPAGVKPEKAPEAETAETPGTKP
jgi:hypothetical protein